MAAATVFDCENFIFSIIGTVKKDVLRRCAKFCQTQTTAEICQFLISQDGGRCHLGFLKFQIFNGLNGQEVRTASPSQISSKSL